MGAKSFIKMDYSKNLPAESKKTNPDKANFCISSPVYRL